MMTARTLIAAVLTGGFAMAGCQSVGGASPARLSTDEDPQMERLKAGLATALGRANIEFGAGDPLGEGTVVVLPPPPTALETHSLAMPITFDLEVRGETCIAVRRDTGEAFELPGVDCTAKG